MREILTVFYQEIVKMQEERPNFGSIFKSQKWVGNRGVETKREREIS